MTIRRIEIKNDIQKCIKAMLDAKITADDDWDNRRWTVIRSYPGSDLMDQISKAIIWIDEPVLSAQATSQGSSQSNNEYRLNIGVLTDNKTGMIHEAASIMSRFEDLFTDPAVLNAITFNITLGATSYTSKTLMQMGIYVNTESVVSMPLIPGHDAKHVRAELTVYLEV